MSLDKRMKKYEQVTRQRMTQRMPIIIRIDGRSFHSYNFEEPFDEHLNTIMAESARAVCKDVSGAKFAYIQSDEASILITTYDSLDFQPHFNNRVQKLVSTVASRFTAEFNELMDLKIKANFDARVFPIPRNDVCNYFIWRQLDWERNSIRMLGLYYFPSSELHGSSNDEVQEKLWQEADRNWSGLENWKKNGACIYKKSTEKYVEAIEDIVKTDFWYIDKETPQFMKNRKFVEQWVFLNEEETTA